MINVNELYKLTDEPRIIGALQTLEVLQKSQMQPAVKFFGNSVNKQFNHMQSEIKEVWKELASDEFDKNKISMEVIDLQFSCQTMLEGPLKLTKPQIADYIQQVVKKNADRKYDKPE